MSKKSRAALKAFFETGDVPTQAEFEDFIDSEPNFVDDNISVFFPSTWNTQRHTYNTTIIALGGGSAAFSFNIPPDFITLVSVNLVLIPEITDAVHAIHFFSSYGLPGEDSRTNTQDNDALTFDLTSDFIELVDLSSVLSSLSANDFAGLEILNDNSSANANLFALGILLVYKNA